MSRNSDVVGILLILLFITNGNNQSAPGGFSSLGNILKAVQVNGLLNELHKFTAVINRVDNLGQMALNPPEISKLPPPDQLFAKRMPDLSNIIETMGPLLSVLSKDSGKENQNDIF